MREVGVSDAEDGPCEQQLVVEVALLGHQHGTVVVELEIGVVERDGHGAGIGNAVMILPSAPTTTRTHEVGEPLLAVPTVRPRLAL